MHGVGWRAGLAACLVAASGAVSAQAQPPIDWSLSAGVAMRHLEEFAPGGGRLLTERGPVGLLQLQGRRELAGGGALALRLSLGGGDIDYDGRTAITQQPLFTTTRQVEGGVDLLWRPTAPGAYGEGWLTAGWFANRRHIQATGSVGGLDERSDAWFLGALWRSPSWQPVAGWRAHGEVEARASVRHRLDVDFYGLFDSTRFEGARRRQVALRLVAAPEASPWSWTLEWSRFDQGDSPRAPLSRNGAPFGSVYQPALQVDDLALRVARRF